MSLYIDLCDSSHNPQRQGFAFHGERNDTAMNVVFESLYGARK